MVEGIYNWSLQSNKLDVFYGTPKFITVFIKHGHWNLFWARSIELTQTLNFALRTTLILSSSLASGLFSLGFSTNQFPFILTYVRVERPWTDAGAQSFDGHMQAISADGVRIRTFSAQIY